MSPLRRNAIITGAASGLGRALALQLARQHWHVAICDVDQAESEQTLRELQAVGGSGQIELFDVRCPDAWQAMRDRLRATWPQLDLLVNNAGVAGAGEVGAFSLEDWRWIVETNLWSTVYGCHTLVDWLIENRSGAHILNTASMAAIESAPPTAAYNVTKAAIVSLSETLYAQLLPRGVGVTVLCPGSFPTRLNDSLRAHGEHWRTLLRRLSDQATLTADEVARQALRAVGRKQLYVMLPGTGRWRWYLKRAAPQAFLRGVSRAVYARRNREEAGESPAPPRP